jgi:hypothetical protein
MEAGQRALNKKRTIALIGALSTIVLGAVAWRALAFDPAMLAMVQSTLGHMAGVEQEDQEFIPLQYGFSTHYGFINSKGMCVIPPAFERTRSFSEGLCAVRVKKKWGFVNKRGEMVIKPTFSKVKDFSEGLAAVKVGAVWGYIDRVGNYLVKPSRWLEANSFRNGIAIVADGPKKGIIYRSGEYICRDLDSVGPLSNGFYCIEKGGRYGYIRQDGRTFVEPKYENANDFSEGLAAVSQDKKWGYIDSSFKSVIAPHFSSAADFHNGLAVVSESGKYGIVDRNGSFRLRPIYKYLAAIPPIDTSVKSSTNVTPFSGAAVTSSSSSSGAQVKTDTVTCSPGMGVSTILVDGVAYSSTSSEGSAKGAALSKAVKGESSTTAFVPVELSDGSELTPIVVNQLWGFADSNGALVIPAQFAEVRRFSEGLASVASFDRPDYVANHIRSLENIERLNAEQEREEAAEAMRVEAKQAAFIASEAQRRGVSPAKVAAEIKAKEEADLDSESSDSQE